MLFVVEIILPTLRSERKQTYSPFLPISEINGNVLTIAPNQNWFGEIEISLTVSDGEYYIQDNFIVEVLEVDDPPVAYDISSIAPGSTYPPPITPRPRFLSLVFPPGGTIYVDVANDPNPSNVDPY